ncbi:MAG TPA: hypothetical protein V6C57_03585 [Coleofasciculaceae cyanobacterium]
MTHPTYALINRFVKGLLCMQNILIKPFELLHPAAIVKISF